MEKKKMDSKFVPVLIIFLIVMSIISMGFPMSSSQSEEQLEKMDAVFDEMVSEGIRETVEDKSKNDLIEVVIRLEPFENDETTDVVFSERNAAAVLREYSEDKQSRIVESVRKSNGRVINQFWIANMVLAEIEVGQIEELLKIPYVTQIHENFEVASFEHQENLPPRDLPPDEYLNMTVEYEPMVKKPANTSDMTWGLERMNVASAWDKGFTGSGVRVAVSDTGVDIDHPDLEGKMITTDETDEHYPGGWIEFDNEGHIVTDSVPYDSSDHGTHVSGTIFGGNSSGERIGVAPDAEMMHALVLTSGVGTFAQVSAGLQWKVEPYDRHGDVLEPVEDYRPHIASMSWGSSGYSDIFEEPVANLYNAGIIPVAAMGNSGHGTVGNVASIYECIGIGASDPDDNITDFSSGDIVEDRRGTTPVEYVKPDYSAPGLNVKSSVPGGGWELKSGTSMAAPHFTGSVALLLDANSNISIEMLHEVLDRSVDYYEDGNSLPDDEDKNTRYGYGIPDVSKMIDVIHNVHTLDVVDLGRDYAVLKGELVNMKEGYDEAEVSFWVHLHNSSGWVLVTPIVVNSTGGYEMYVGDFLLKGSYYDYRATVFWDGDREKREDSYHLTFKTHEDVMVDTLPVNDKGGHHLLLEGNVTDLYVDEAEVFFKYRELGTDEWNETDSVNVKDTTDFQIEVDGLDYMTFYEYKAVGVVDGVESEGDKRWAMTTCVEPEWDEDKEAYLITNVGELQWVRNNLSADYVMMNDIDASVTREWYHGDGFEPLGDRDDGEEFRGTFDGNGYTIDNLYIYRPDRFNVGLFGWVYGRYSDVNGYVSNLLLTNASVTGYGWVYGGVGILAGTNFYGTLDNVSVQGDVYGTARAGGLVGQNWGLVKHCYSDVNVTTDRYHTGGLIGAHWRGVVTDSYSHGYVTTNRWGRIGGLTGRSNSIIYNSYATTKVDTDDGEGGGLVHMTFENMSRVYDSFWDINATGMEYSVNGTGKTTEEMKNISTFTDLETEGLNNTWDFVGNPNDDDGDDWIWNMDDGFNDGYPFLNWRQPENITEYELDISSGYGGEVTTPGEGTFSLRKGEEVTVEAIPEENYTFVGWSGDISYIGDVSDAQTSVRMPLKNISVMASFELMDRNITLGSTSGGSVKTPGEGSFNHIHGTVLDLEAVPEQNYHFVEWDGDIDNVEDITSNSTTVTLTEDISLTAVFSLDEHTLEVSLEGGGNVLTPGEGSFSYVYGDIVELEAVPDEQHHFVGWSGDTDEITDVNSNKTTIDILDDYSITAVFSVNRYELTIDVDDDGKVISPGEGTFEYDYGSVVELEAVPDEHHHFIGWSGDVDTVADVNSTHTTVEILGDIEIKASFGINLYELNISSECNGEVSSPGEGVFLYEYNTTIHVEAVPDEHYHFVEWVGDISRIEDPLDNSTYITVKENLTVAAVFSINVYELDLSSTTGGDADIIGEDGHVFEAGTVLEINAVPEEGYHFLRWSGDNGTIQEPYSRNTSIVMHGNYSVTAVFSINVYELTVTSWSGGDVLSPIESVTYHEHGSVVELHAVPYEYHHFVEWTRDVDEIADVNSNKTTVEILDDYRINAVFGIEEFEVDVNSGDGGVIAEPDESPAVVRNGSFLELTAVPNEGHYFTGWIGDVENVEDIYSESTTVQVFDDYSISAEFSINVYELTVTSGDGGKISLPESSVLEYEHGETVSLEALPDEHYHFVRWEGDTDEMTNVNSRQTTIKMLDNYSVTAVFSIEMFEVHVSSGDGGEIIEPEDSPILVENGAVIELNASPEEGYYFSGWSGNIEEIEDHASKSTTVQVFDDYTITAEFSKFGYELEINVVGNGIETNHGEGTHGFVHGREVVLNVTAADGWVFAGWSGDASGDVEEISLFMDEDKVVTAIFEELEFGLKIANFEVEPMEGDLPLEVTITAEIENVGDIDGDISLSTNGFEINSWNVEPGEIITVRESYVYEDVGLYDVILGEEGRTVQVGEVTTYTLDIDVEGQGTVDVFPDREVHEEGEEAALTALPESGWEFVSWDGIDADESEIKIIMDSNKSITAIFQEVEDDENGEDEEVSENLSMFTIEILDLKEVANEDNQFILEYRVENVGETEGDAVIRCELNGLNSEEVSLTLGSYEHDEDWLVLYLDEDVEEYDINLTVSNDGDIDDYANTSIVLSDGEDEGSSPYLLLIIILLLIVAASIILFSKLGPERYTDKIKEHVYKVKNRVIPEVSEKKN